jgi:hypothetical protein
MHTNCVRRLAVIALLLSMGVPLGAAQTPLQRTFPNSKAALEKALRNLGAYSGGRLPILDGFVAESSLERYQRPFYQYSLQVTCAGADSCTVRVGARITAWYADPSPSQSGYRVLASNGRLEADLLDRLQDTLGTKASAAELPAVPASKPPAAAAAPEASAPPPYIKPGPPVAALPRFGAAPSLPSRAESSEAEPPKDDLRIEQLSKEAKNLEQILRNQAHPENLAVVKNPNVPVVEQPDDNGKVLFLAGAEDEFQIVDTAGPWVHVQVSGLSRGWIRRSELQLPTAYEGAAPVTAAELGPSTPFRQTRQETAAFPGNWEALKGKQVKVIWVQPASSSASDADKFSYAKGVFRKAFPELLHSSPPLAGVVIVFDSEDGGMAAATLATLQQWNAHHMTDNIFWKQCWFDPAEAFKLKD